MLLAGLQARRTLRALETIEYSETVGFGLQVEDCADIAQRAVHVDDDGWCAGCPTIATPNHFPGRGF